MKEQNDPAIDVLRSPYAVLLGRLRERKKKKEAEWVKRRWGKANNN